MFVLTYPHSRFCFTNKDAPANLTAYVFRGSDGARPLYSGGTGLLNSIPETIENITQIQSHFRGENRIGKRIVHAYISLDGDEAKLAANDFQKLSCYAESVSQYYFQMGFVNFFCIWEIPEGYEIHYCISSVNRFWGNKLECTEAVRGAHEEDVEWLFRWMFGTPALVHE